MALRAQRGARSGLGPLRPSGPAGGRRRLLPPRDRPRPRHGRVGLGLGLLAVLGRGALYLERDGATGLYRISSGGRLLTESGNRAVLAEPDGSSSQLWRVSALGGGRYSFTSASGLALDDRGQRTSEGNTVWLYEPNGGPAQAWVLT